MAPTGPDSSHDLLRIIKGADTLCLDVQDPGWDDARGYLVWEDPLTLCFPVAKKYLDGRDLARYEVLIWSQPRVLVRGVLSRVTAEDTPTLLALAQAKHGEEAGHRYVFGQSGRKARRVIHKLVVDEVTGVGASPAE